MEATGPVFLDRCMQYYPGNDVTAFDDIELFPWIYADGRRSGRITANTVAVHYSQCTWHDKNITINILNKM